MCLVHSARDMTKDVGALYEPKEEVNRLVKKIVEQEGLPKDWLNDGVKGDEAYNILIKFYPANRILPKTMYVIQEYIDDLQDHTQSPGFKSPQM